MKFQIQFVLCLFYCTIFAQSNSAFDRFSNQVDTASDKQQKLRYARLWLEQARSEKNFSQEVKALREVMYSDNRDFLLCYSDSLLAAAVNTKDTATIGQAYLTKGIAHYNQNQHAAALNAYMKADEYLHSSGADYDVHKLKYGIANTKYYLGFYQEAISLFEQCRSHYKNNDTRGYLSAIYSLGLCYNRLGDYERSEELNRLGFTEERRLDDQKIHGYFVNSNGINDYYLGRYEAAQRQLQQARSFLGKREDYSNLAVTWFYLGKVNLALNKQDLALTYLRKVDSSFYQQKYIRPDLRQTYEILIKHYYKTGDYQNEIHFIRRLKTVDSVLNRDYKYLTPRLTKEYDNRKLNQAYEKAVERLQLKDKLEAYCGLVFVLVIGFILYKYVKLRRYHRNYKKMMDQPVEASNESIDNASERDLPEDENPDLSLTERSSTPLKTEKEINPEIVARALINLSEFELKEKYRDSAVGVQELAEIMETNSTYARQIIQEHRHKSIVQYLHDLRLDFIVRKLRTDSRFRNYTDEALAEECGFGSTKNFTRAFKANYDIPPRFFIRQLKKDMGEE